jgi:hypothetical protein
MRKALMLLVVACGVGLISPHADAKHSVPTEDGYQTATVVSVKKHVSDSYYGGDNPSDAPLQTRDYSYDIGIRLNCNIYVGRYQSPTRYLPSVFAPHHEVDVRLRKHIMYVSLPFSDDEVMMGIVAHKRMKDEMCAAPVPAASTSQPSKHQLTQNKFKGGLV